MWLGTFCESRWRLDSLTCRLQIGCAAIAPKGYGGIGPPGTPENGPEGAGPFRIPICTRKLYIDPKGKSIDIAGRKSLYAGTGGIGKLVPAIQGRGHHLCSGGNGPDSIVPTMALASSSAGKHPSNIRSQVGLICFSISRQACLP